jgi:hypothetical protein
MNSALRSSIVFIESPCLTSNDFNSSSINVRTRSSVIGSLSTIIQKQKKKKYILHFSHLYKT